MTVSFTLMGTPSAQADPDKPTTVAQAKAQVDKLEAEASAIDQDYAAAQEKLAKSTKKLAADNKDLAKQEKKVSAMRTQVAKVALTNFQQRNTSTAATFLTSQQDNVFSRLSMMQQVTANQKAQLQAFQAEQANLNDLKTSAEADVAVQTKAKADMADARKRSKTKVEQAKKVLAQLTEEQRRKIAAERAAQERQDREAAARTQTQTRTRTTHETSRSHSHGATKTTIAPAVPASGRAATAVAFARAQVGKPYSYGGTGPGAYDCSGLTGAAWRAAGVGLPRTSQAQFGAGRSVSTSNLRPGDLVFYYSGISHVGIYIGGGMIVHAANPRSGVTYAGVHSMPLMGARRVG